MNTPDPKALRKSRLFLLLIAFVFVAPALIAGILVMTGWQPGVKGNGDPIIPQRNFASERVRIAMADGQLYPWRAATPQMTLIALSGPDCAAHCMEVLTGMAKARVMLNHRQGRLRLLFLGTPPANAADRAAMLNFWQVGTDVDGTLASYRPTAPDSVSALLVESNGTALSSYPVGFDTSGVLRDLKKVIK